jgi:hypothetical protein
MGVVHEDLVAKLADLEAREKALAEREAQLAASNGAVGFSRSEKNPNFYSFKHGTRGAWPVSTTPEAWRVIVANIHLVKKGLNIK